MNKQEFLKKIDELVNEYIDSDDFEEIYEGYNIEANSKEFCFSIQLFDAINPDEE